MKNNTSPFTIAKKYVLFLLLLSCFAQYVSGQEKKSHEDVIEEQYEGIAASLYMDSIVITAARSGFDVEDFIKMVLNDRSYYKAFQRLKTTGYTVDHEIYFMGPKNQVDAAYTCIREQEIFDNCRHMHVILDRVEGNYYRRRKKLRYYTAGIFNNIFFSQDTICRNNGQDDTQAPNKTMDQHINQLKQVVFTPGLEMDVPFFGTKMAIFSKKMRPYYDYIIRSENYQDSIDCYVFEVTVKNEFKEDKKSVVLRNLVTYFDKSNMEIVARDYKMKYESFLYSFDFNIQTKLEAFQNEYLPYLLEYEGYWNVLFKPAEIGKFKTRFFNFNRPKTTTDKVSP